MAAGNTYTAIATQTLGSAAASVTFSSISGAYTDLVLIVSAGNDTNQRDMLMQVNGDTASNYSYTYLTGSGSAASSGRGSGATSYLCNWNAPLAAPSTLYSEYRINLLNYSNTTTYKTFLERADNGATGYGTDAIVGLWRSTSAITSILLKPSAYNFATGSTFTLYGILAA